MAIYDFKEFLDIDDVADYLTDRRAVRLHTVPEIAEKTLKDLLTEWVRHKKNNASIL